MKIGMTLIGIALIIVSLAIGYYFVIYIPQKDVAQRASQEQFQLNQTMQKNAQAQKLQDCLTQASSDQHNYWMSECKDFGTNVTADNCDLPAYNATQVNNSYQSAKEDCFKQYPQN